MTGDDPDAAIRAVVDRAPPLTNAQRVALAELLKPVRVTQPRLAQ